MGTDYVEKGLYYLYSEENDLHYSLNQSISNTGGAPPVSGVLTANASVENKMLRILRGNSKLVVGSKALKEPIQQQ